MLAKFCTERSPDEKSDLIPRFLNYLSFKGNKRKAAAGDLGVISHPELLENFAQNELAEMNTIKAALFEMEARFNLPNALQTTWAFKLGFNKIG